MCEASKYGFGRACADAPIKPYNISSIVVSDFPHVDNLSAFEDLEGLISNYPIFSGSCVFLGTDHSLCEDIDLVMYLYLPQSEQVRRDAALHIKNAAMNLSPTSISIAQNTKIGPRKLKASSRHIKELIDDLLVEESLSHDIAKLRYIHFSWDTDFLGFDKPVSISLHITHATVEADDIHPYQECHYCDFPSFFHGDRHWLQSSLRKQYLFLREKIGVIPVEDSPTKATKRALVLLGLIGLFEEQASL